MKNSFDEKNLKEINNWLKASKKIALATQLFFVDQLTKHQVLISLTSSSSNCFRYVYLLFSS